MKAHLMAGGVLALTANMEEHILSVIIPPRQTCSTVSRCVLCEWKTTSTSTGRPASLQAFRGERVCYSTQAWAFVSFRRRPECIPLYPLTPEPLTSHQWHLFICQRFAALGFCQLLNNYNISVVFCPDCFTWFSGFFSWWCISGLFSFTFSQFRVSTFLM